MNTALFITKETALRIAGDYMFAIRKRKPEKAFVKLHKQRGEVKGYIVYIDFKGHSEVLLERDVEGLSQ